MPGEVLPIDFLSLFHALPSPYMILDHDLKFIDANDEYCRTTGRSKGELLGRYVFDLFPETPEREQKFLDAFRRALAGDRVVLDREYFSIPAADGSKIDVWWTCHQIPVRDANGEVIGVLQKAVDVSSAVRAETMREATLRELDHRVKNVLTKVHAIAQRTARTSDNLDLFMARYTQRIEAMARVQSLLRDGPEQHGLIDLLLLELEPYDAADSITPGEKIILTSDAALSLGLAFHELATNAAKYGAFSVPGGTLAVSWHLDGDQLVIDWVERGVTPTGDPGDGFGSTILRRIVPQELKAQVEWTIGANGLNCRIVAPTAMCVEPDELAEAS